jgi:quinol monooxygenase YgiN
VYSLVAR